MSLTPAVGPFLTSYPTRGGAFFAGTDFFSGRRGVSGTLATRCQVPGRMRASSVSGLSSRVITIQRGTWSSTELLPLAEYGGGDPPARLATCFDRRITDRTELASPKWQARVTEILPIGSETPERYVALHAHEWMLEGLLAYRFPDPVVDEYVGRVAELICGDGDALARRVLTADEYEQLQVTLANYDF